MDTKTRIKAARSRLGITQKVVADHCGVSITTVSKWEHGEALPQRRQEPVRRGGARWLVGIR